MRFVYILLVLSILSSCQPKKVEATHENIEAILKEDFTFKYSACGCFGCSSTNMRIDSKNKIIAYELFSDNDSLLETKKVVYSDKKRKVLEELIDIGSKIDSSELSLCTLFFDYRIYNENIAISFRDQSCRGELEELLKEFLE